MFGAPTNPPGTWFDTITGPLRVVAPMRNVGQLVWDPVRREVTPVWVTNTAAVVYQ